MKPRKLLLFLFVVTVLLILSALLSLPKARMGSIPELYLRNILVPSSIIIAIALALITKVYSSLFIGILSAALLYANFNPLKAFTTMFKRLHFVPRKRRNVGILIFLVVLGVIVCLVNKAGGSAAYGEWASKRIKTRNGAILATFGLGVLIFVDDYFNCLTVGNVMRPVTDKHKVSRAKLAYLVDATAAPICMIAPISSWAAAVVGVVEGYDGLSSLSALFLTTFIPF